MVHVRALTTTATGLRTRTNMLNASMRKQNYETRLPAIEDNSGVTKQCAVSSNLHARSTGNYSPVTTSACTLAATLCYASHICGCTPCHRCQVIVHVLSLHDRTHACVLAPLSSASPLLSVRNGRHRALSISFVPLSLSLANLVSLGRTLVLK